MQQSVFGKVGALLCSQRCTVTPILYWIRSGTSSQCRSSCRSRDKPWSNLCVPVMRRAAAFIRRCSLSAQLDDPARMAMWGTENAGVENSGVEISARNSKKRQGWKMQE